jgi:hypothetical protein
MAALRKGVLEVALASNFRYNGPASKTDSRIQKKAIP